MHVSCSVGDSFKNWRPIINSVSPTAGPHLQIRKLLLLQYVSAITHIDFELFENCMGGFFNIFATTLRDKKFPGCFLEKAPNFFALILNFQIHLSASNVMITRTASTGNGIDVLTHWTFEQFV